MLQKQRNGMRENEITIRGKRIPSFFVYTSSKSGKFTAHWNNGVTVENEWGIEDIERSADEVRITSDDKITGLEMLGYSWLSNPGISVDLTHCKSLRELVCMYPGEMDLSHNRNLRILSIKSSSMTTLDLQANPKLEQLEIKNCDGLEILDLSNCPRLVHLQLCYCPALKTVILGDESALHLYEYKAVALSRESEDKILCTIERNGGYVEKIYLGDTSQW